MHNLKFNFLSKLVFLSTFSIVVTVIIKYAILYFRFKITTILHFLI